MDTVLGLIGLALYVLAILSLSAAITYAVVKISPAKASKNGRTTPDRAPGRRGRGSDASDGAAQGSWGSDAGRPAAQTASASGVYGSPCAWATAS